jgi:hypothetical protein
MALAFATAAAADDALLQQWDAPKRETFALKKMPGRDAAFELRRRYGYDFDAAAAEGDVAFKAKDVTFFEALDRLGAALDLYVTGVPVPEERRKWTEGGLALTRPETPLGPAIAVYLGPSRLSVESVSVLAVRRCAPEPRPTGLGDLPVRIIRDIQDFSSTAAESPRLRLQLRWIVEPGFDDVSLRGLSLGQVLDDKGKPVMLRREPRLPVSANTVLALDFPAPPPGTKAIRKLQAVARVSIPVERAELTFAPTDAGVTKQLGRASLTLEGTDGTTVRIALVGTPAGLASDGLIPIAVGTSARIHDEPPDLTVIAYDDKGAAIDGHARESSSDESGRCTYQLEYDRPPARLDFRAITKLVARDMPFTLTNIPLPE